jgi:chemotaxis methyl-accepting protein methylase
MNKYSAPVFKRQPFQELISLVCSLSKSDEILKYNDQFLFNTLQTRIKETYCKNADEYLTLISNNSDEANFLKNSLQISYSDFFRNPLTFSVLQQIILPLLIDKKKVSKRKEIRIWSAACAGGQESYSLAIALEELKNGDAKNFSYRIFATDRNESLVNEASKGDYTQNALNNLSLKRINQWFNKKGDTFSVKKELSNNIDFSVFDLFSEQFSSPPTSIFGEFDIVLCANLLFYYKTEYSQIILKKTGNCMATGGYLVTGETERQILIAQNYTEVFPQSAIFQKR